MAYEVKLEVFEGPIDLLLQLIARQRVEIYDVSLAQITTEYLQAMAGMETLDLEVATGFLVVAATLLELKSSRLLPSGADEDSDLELLEERDLLLARLVECATFRDAGAWIAAALEEGRAYHGREVTLEESFMDLTPDVLHNVTPAKLAGAAAAALAPRSSPVLDISHLAPIRVSVREAIGEVGDRLLVAGRMGFKDLCEGSDRMGVIVRFLALLELLKSGAVALQQTDRFGEIEATWTGEVELATAIGEADEYSVTVDAGVHP